MNLRPWAISAWLILAVAAADAARDGTGVLLDASTSFRFFMVGKTEQARVEGEVREVGFTWNYKMDRPPLRVTPTPPADWSSLPFDASGWPRGRLPLHTGRVHDHKSGMTRDFSLLCARATFQVDDPTRAGDLALDLVYRGGVVVLLNGRELARGDMPEGELRFDTPADDYPIEAYIGPDGVLLRPGFGDPAVTEARMARRNRRLTVTIPAGRLARGVNVLAVQAHRPLTDPIVFTGNGPDRSGVEPCQWETLALIDLRLTGGGAAASCRPAGLRAWNLSPAQAATTADGAAVGETLQPVRLIGARNGAFSGQVVLGSDAAIRGLKAAATALIGPSGAKIAADAFELRFGLADQPDAEPAGDPRTYIMIATNRIAGEGIMRFDSLSALPPEEVAAQNGMAVIPIWITVRVPANVRTGEYSGKIEVTADGGTRLEVPLTLSVADWTLPPVIASSSWWWLVQSPDTLAAAYNEPMWSDRHLELIGRSFDLARQVGTRIIYVPLFPGSYLGNEHGMVRWIKGTEDAWRCDFAPFERYLDAALRHLGKLDVVCVSSWPRNSGGQFLASSEFPEGKAEPYPLTLIDPRTGACTNIRGPTWNDTEAIRALLKPAFDGIRERLNARGVAAQAFMIGIGHDVQPNKNAITALNDASNGARWVLHAHRLQWAIHGFPVGYLADVFGSPGFGWPGGKRLYGWQQERFHATFPRITSKTIGRIDDDSPLSQYRISCEAAMLSGMRGIGWIGADFWPVLEGARGRLDTLLDRHPMDHRWNLGLHWSVTHLLGRGPDGPLPTLRHQMVRAGLQEAEARAFIERALMDGTQRARLGETLATRCQKLLDDRQTAMTWTRLHWEMLAVSDWEQRAADLFAAAGEVAAALAQGG